jgi:hypothetical protein
MDVRNATCVRDKYVDVAGFHKLIEVFFQNRLLRKLEGMPKLTCPAITSEIEDVFSSFVVTGETGTFLII